MMAEREGFEPPMGLHPCRISSAVHSTTLPPLRGAWSAFRRGADIAIVDEDHKRKLHGPGDHASTTHKPLEIS